MEVQFGAAGPNSIVLRVVESLGRRKLGYGRPGRIRSGRLLLRHNADAHSGVLVQRLSALPNPSRPFCVSHKM